MNDPHADLALLTLEFPPHIGGVQELLFQISQHLGALTRLAVISPVGGAPPSPMAFTYLQARATSPWALARRLRALAPGHVLLGHAHPRLLLAAALVADGHYSTWVYGDDVLAAQRRWHRPAFNWLLNRSRSVITLSNATARLLVRTGAPRVRIIRPGVDAQRFRPPDHPPAPPLTLLTVGRLVARKGHATVLRALPKLLSDFPGLRYRIVGEGPERSNLEQLANSLNVQGAVQFLGRTPSADLPTIYQEAHVFVMPVRDERQTASIEGFGLVFLEASATGLPVVAGRSGGAVEAVRDHETGILVDPDDPDELEQGLRRLLHDAGLRRRMGQAGRQWVATEMTWERAAQELADLLELPGRPAG